MKTSFFWILLPFFASCALKKKQTNEGRGEAAPLPVRAIVSQTDLAPPSNLAVLTQQDLTKDINSESTFENPTKLTSSTSNNPDCQGLQNFPVRTGKDYVILEGIVDIRRCYQTQSFTGTAQMQIVLGISCSQGADFSSFNGRRLGDLTQMAADCPANSVKAYFMNSISQFNGTLSTSTGPVAVDFRTLITKMNSVSEPCLMDYRQNEISVRDCIYTYRFQNKSGLSNTFKEIKLFGVTGKLKANLFDSGSAPFIFNNWTGTMNYSQGGANWNARDQSGQSASGQYTPELRLMEFKSHQLLGMNIPIFP